MDVDTMRCMNCCVATESELDGVKEGSEVKKVEVGSDAPALHHKSAGAECYESAVDQPK